MEADQIHSILQGAYKRMRSDRSPWPLTGSALGGCPRRLAHRLAGIVESPRSPESKRLLELGHQRGARMHEVFAGEMPKSVACLDEYPVWIPITTGNLATEVYGRAREEFPQKPRPYMLMDEIFCVKGHMDTLIVDEGEATIIDYKTVSSFGFGKLDEEGPSDEYRLQLMAYATGLQFEDTHGIAVGLEPIDNIRMFLVYESKDGDARKGHVGGQIKVVEVDSDPELYTGAILKAEEALRAWLDHHSMMVPEPYPIGGKTGTAKALPWQCNYCGIGPEIGGCYGPVENRSKNPLRPKWYLMDNDE